MLMKELADFVQLRRADHPTLNGEDFRQPPDSEQFALRSPALNPISLSHVSSPPSKLDVRPDLSEESGWKTANPDPLLRFSPRFAIPYCRWSVSNRRQREAFLV